MEVQLDYQKTIGALEFRRIQSQTDYKYFTVDLPLSQLVVSECAY